MLLGGGLVLYFVALHKIPGGWAAMAAASPERFHLYQPPNDLNAPFLGLLFSSLGVGLFYQSSNQVMMQRVLAARTTWDGLMGIIFAGFINLFRPLVTCFLGFIVYHWINHMHRAEPLENPDTTFPFALTTFAPAWGLRGIILAGFIAAVMSATSALANSTATIFALEIYRRVIRPNAEERTVVRVGQTASLLALVIAALICPAVAHLGGIFRYFQTGVTWLATPFISVFILGILWKRTNYPGAIFGLIGGLVIQAAVAVVLPMLGIKMHWFYTAAIAQAITMIGIALVSLVTAPPDREKIETLVWRPALLEVHRVGPGRPWYHTPAFWFFIYAGIWISIYWRFW
jgi:SSS family solute:Na+ symporter